MNTMVSSGPQLAADAPEAPHRVEGAPPPIATFLSLRSAKKPTHWPSGEKKGANPPSVPGIGLDSS